MRLLKIFFIAFGTLVYSLSVDAKDYTILEFGAVPDTTILSTKAIQTAIDACSQEGGTVLIPSGNWLSGTLILRSNVTLNLAKGATLYGSRHLGDYPGNVPNYIALRTRGNAKQLIYAENQHNISIIGEGEIPVETQSIASLPQTFL